MPSDAFWLSVDFLASHLQLVGTAAPARRGVTAADGAAREAVPRGVLDTQLAYYRARAPEYDEWFHRHGRYDRGPEQTATRGSSELAVVRAWLRSLDLDGAAVLELAPGTGLWTAELLAAGAVVTAVDGAPEMLEALDRRCAGPRLTTVLADLFAWAPSRRYDVVVACFFMSHVPDERFAAFLELVAAARGARAEGCSCSTACARRRPRPATTCSPTSASRRCNDGSTTVGPSRS